MIPAPWRSWLLVAAILSQPEKQALSRFTGLFRGTARSASGPLQLGLPWGVQTMFRLDTQSDSLVLRAISNSGTLDVIAAWPIRATSVHGDTLEAKGTTARASSLVNRRSLTWIQSGNFIVSAKLTTPGSPSRADDYWNSNTVRLTLMRTGQPR